MKTYLMQEAADKVGVHSNTLRRWLDIGVTTCGRAGNYRVINEKELEKLRSYNEKRLADEELRVYNVRRLSENTQHIGLDDKLKKLQQSIRSNDSFFAYVRN